MTRDEWNRWCFAHMDGREMSFISHGMPFKVMKHDAEFGGVAYIGDCKCRVRIVHRQDAEKGKRYEVRFPDTELDVKLATEDTTLVGYMEIKGNWREHEGKCVFHPIGKNG